MTMEKEQVLVLENITKAYGTRFSKEKKRVLGPVSLCIRKGEAVGITGENGAGKSTLMSVLFGLYHGNIVQGIYACILGCLLGFVAYKANSLLASMILHFSINLSVLFIPSVWFEDTVRCGIITAGALVLTVLFVWLAMRKKEETKNTEK